MSEMQGEWPRLIITIERSVDIDLSDPDEREMFENGQPFDLYELLRRRLGLNPFMDVEVDARFE